MRIKKYNQVSIATFLLISLVGTSSVPAVSLPIYTLRPLASAQNKSGAEELTNALKRQNDSNANQPLTNQAVLDKAQAGPLLSETKELADAAARAALGITAGQEEKIEQFTRDRILLRLNTGREIPTVPYKTGFLAGLAQAIADPGLSGTAESYLVQELPPGLRDVVQTTADLIGRNRFTKMDMKVAQTDTGSPLTGIAGETIMEILYNAFSRGFGVGLPLSDKGYTAIVVSGTPGSDLSVVSIPEIGPDFQDSQFARSLANHVVDQQPTVLGVDRRAKYTLYEIGTGNTDYALPKYLAGEQGRRGSYLLLQIDLPISFAGAEERGWFSRNKGFFGMVALSVAVLGFAAYQIAGDQIAEQYYLYRHPPTVKQAAVMPSGLHVQLPPEMAGKYAVAYLETDRFYPQVITQVSADGTAAFHVEVRPPNRPGWIAARGRVVAVVNSKQAANVAFREIKDPSALNRLNPAAVLTIDSDGKVTSDKDPLGNQNAGQEESVATAIDQLVSNSFGATNVITTEMLFNNSNGMVTFQNSSYYGDQTYELTLRPWVSLLSDHPEENVDFRVRVSLQRKDFAVLSAAERKAMASYEFRVKGFPSAEFQSGWTALSPNPQPKNYYDPGAGPNTPPGFVIPAGADMETWIPIPIVSDAFRGEKLAELQRRDPAQRSITIQVRKAGQEETVVVGRILTLQAAMEKLRTLLAGSNHKQIVFNPEQNESLIERTETASVKDVSDLTGPVRLIGQYSPNFDNGQGEGLVDIRTRNGIIYVNPFPYKAEELSLKVTQLFRRGDILVDQTTGVRHFEVADNQGNAVDAVPLVSIINGYTADSKVTRVPAADLRLRYRVIRAVAAGAEENVEELAARLGDEPIKVVETLPSSALLTADAKADVVRYLRGEIEEAELLGILDRLGIVEIQSGGNFMNQAELIRAAAKERALVERAIAEDRLGEFIPIADGKSAAVVEVDVVSSLPKVYLQNGLSSPVAAPDDIAIIPLSGDIAEVSDQWLNGAGSESDLVILNNQLDGVAAMPGSWLPAVAPRPAAVRMSPVTSTELFSGDAIQVGRNLRAMAALSLAVHGVPDMDINGITFVDLAGKTYAVITSA